MQMKIKKIISWNVASVRARLPVLVKLLEKEQPDIVLLQEIKAEEANFPFVPLLEKGYQSVISGQKSYNGVAILSKEKLLNVKTSLPLLCEEDKSQARFIEATLPSGEVVISVYVPNGNPPEKQPENQEKLVYKLRWMAGLTEYITRLLSEKKHVILGGDFNVIEKDTDVYNPEPYRKNALMLPEVRGAFEKLSSLDVINTIRLFNPEPHTYSFWDFQMGAWAKNYGMLLDAFFVDRQTKDHVKKSGIYKDVRGWEKTSDHAPIYIEIEK